MFLHSSLIKIIHRPRRKNNKYDFSTGLRTACIYQYMFNMVDDFKIKVLYITHALERIYTRFPRKKENRSISHSGESPLCFMWIIFSTKIRILNSSDLIKLDNQNIQWVPTQQRQFLNNKNINKYIKASLHVELVYCLNCGVYSGSIFVVYRLFYTINYLVYINTANLGNLVHIEQSFKLCWTEKV